VCIALLTMVLSGAFAESPPTGTDAAVEVALNDGLLTLRASEAPLVDVIREIGNAVGFETLVYGELRHQITRSMTDVPLEDALAELLQDVSNVMTFDPSAALAQVRLYGTSAAAGASPAAETDTPEPAVITRKLDPETAARLAAIRDEAAQGVLEAQEELTRLLREDADPAVRSRAAAALGEIGDPAVVSALQIGAGDSEQIVRLRAIRALAAVKDDQSTQVLADVLFSHPDTRTRLLAVWALRQHDSPLARSYLEASGTDGNQLVRQAVARPRREETAKGPSDGAEAQDGASTETPPAETEEGTDALSGAGTVTQ
jgi:hypothetical protein